ncbi:MAG: helix-turn-helix transcriptional regulator [Clostridiales bacterium]|nr:helix-turn-helix transcriptional regulator [Clostridiales bacterium]
MGKDVLKTLKEIRVLNDPYRREILTTFSIIDRPATAKEVAKMMGEAPSKVNYHIGVLHQYDFIELHHTESINGIIAKYYKRNYIKFTINMDIENTGTKQMQAMRDVIQSTFDTARDQYLETMHRHLKNCQDQPDELHDYLSQQSIYMNENEVEELTSLIDRLSKADRKNRKRYTLFASYIIQGK